MFTYFKKSHLKTRKRKTIEYIAVKIYSKKHYDQYSLEVLYF